MRASSAEKLSAGAASGTRDATRVTVSTFGVLAGLAGIEHGVGEVLRGNVAPEGARFLSWPGSEASELLSGEPAMTIVPNLLATGLLADLVSLVFLVWATVFVGRRHGGPVLMLLSVVMLLVGGGFGSPILGMILGVAATRMGAPPARRSRLPAGLRVFLAKSWPLSLVAGVAAWLALLPGTVLLDFFFGVGDADFIVPVVAFVVLSAFSLLLWTTFAAFAYDARRQGELSTGG